MAPPANAATYTGFQEATVYDGFQHFTLQANESNPQATTPPPAFVVSNTDGSSDFQVTQSGLNQPTSNPLGPAAYPSLYVGLHWPNDPTKGQPPTNPSAGDPFGQTGGPAYDGGLKWWLQVGAMAQGNPDIETSFDMSASTTVAAGSVYDSAFDIWFNSSADGNQVSGTTPSWSTTAIPGTSMEMMIWLNSHGMTPAGYNSSLPNDGAIATNVSIESTTYNVFYQAHNSHSRTITFVATTPTTSLYSLALSPFANEVVALNGVKVNGSTDLTIANSWYLYDVEAGFEIYTGGGPSTGHTVGLSGEMHFNECPGGC